MRTDSRDVQYKFVVCNREGFRDRKRKAIVLHSAEEQVTPKPFDIRNTKLTRTGCTAMIEFFYNRVGVNQGPTTAFRSVKEYVVGYENVGAQLVYFKNFGRDIRCFIEDRDAQLFINHFEDKRDTNQGFYFAYESRKNYSLFGDYITYDPTYSTNKYCMVFTPFTGLDHHKRSVTFAAALLFHEDKDSFKWVFDKFLDVMGSARATLDIDVHRHTQKQLDRDDDCTLPQLSTSLKLEAHASKLYTHAAFADFQLEATTSICSLSVSGFTPPANGTEVIGIADARTQKTYQVIYNSTTNDAKCSCKLFNRKVIICRHIIWIYSGKQVYTLPDKYILMRWTKNAHKIPLYGLHGELMDDFDATELRKLEMCKLCSEFYATISMLKNVPNNQITYLADTLKQFRVKLNPQAKSMTKEQELEMLLGCSSLTEVRILPPRQAKNKGSGKRIISKKQQCIAKAEKPKRLCHNCKQMAHHDKRNCPNAFVPDANNKGVQMRMMLMMVDRLKRQKIKQRKIDDILHYYYIIYTTNFIIRV
ncbi:protein FAR1-RELATED SEQUENCE 5-like [Silene latifolia]|uniref:protein FAR1-RELATED SEQUENCE 5-like n=1 Tax=Silene latifolia TaxID=37657 RepID=UPI003D7838B2